MFKKAKIVTFLFLVIVMLLSLPAVMPMTASAATGAVTINVSTLSVTADNSINAATESQWAYDGPNRVLALVTADGNYTLTGVNTDLRVQVNAVRANVTLNNASIITTSAYPALAVKMDCTVSLPSGSNNSLQGGSREAFVIEPGITCTVNGGGVLTATAGNGPYPNLINENATLNIEGGAKVSFQKSSTVLRVHEGSVINVGLNAQLEVIGTAGSVTQGLHIVGADFILNSDGITTISSTGYAVEPGFIPTFTGSGTINIIGGQSGVFTTKWGETHVPMGDGVTLVITNNATSTSAPTERFIFEKAYASSAYHWKLTGATTSDPLTGESINVTVGAGETFTVQRVSAATGTIEMGGVEVVSDLGVSVDKLTSGGWKWDYTTNTLTLNDTYGGDCIEVKCSDAGTFNLVYSGNVAIKNTAGNAIYCEGSLIITGSGGTLDIQSSGDGIRAEENVTINGGEIVIASAGHYGISVHDDLTITGGTLTAIGEIRAIYPDYTVPGGHTYYVNTTTAPSTTPLAGNGSTTVIGSAHKYAKVVSASAQPPFAPNPAASWEFSDSVADCSGTYGDGTWTWVRSTNTLTLTNIHFSTMAAYALRLRDAATIVLVGSNSITSICANSTESMGIYSQSNLTIEGDGSLTVLGGKATLIASATSYGIRASYQIIINGNAAVYATGGEANGGSTGIRASTQIIINDNAAVSATGGTNESGGSSVGISATSVITVNGNAAVTATGGSAPINSYGIFNTILLAINGGTVTASGNTAALYNNYTVPSGYTYYVNTSASPDTTPHTGNGDTTKIIGQNNSDNPKHKYAKVVATAVSPPVALAGITVTVPPDKTEYAVGETLDLTGLVVTATYSDYSTAPVTGYTTDPAAGTTLNTAGTQTVTVSYSEGGVTKTAGIIITVTEAAGFTVSGTVKSYNPQNIATLRLMQNGVEKYRITTEEGSGSGQWTQNFSFPGVEPGTYTLVISKPAHTSFTVYNIVVADKDVDLTGDVRPEVQLMTLRCGDINGDGNINNSDLTILWQQANYNRSATAAANPLCDLNGDGLINNIDLTILWLAYNYNRGEIEIN